MISIESEIARALDMTELTKNLHYLKLGKSNFPNLKYSKCLSLSGVNFVLMLEKHVFINM